MFDTTPCCGISFWDGLDNVDPHDTLMAMCEAKYPGVDEEWGDDEDGVKQAFIIFADVVGENGEALAAYIKKNDLGYTISTLQKKNPNSGNLIKCWIWSPKERNLKAWYKT